MTLYTKQHTPPAYLPQQHFFLFRHSLSHLLSFCALYTHTHTLCRRQAVNTPFALFPLHSLSPFMSLSACTKTVSSAETSLTLVAQCKSLCTHPTALQSYSPCAKVLSCLIQPLIFQVVGLCPSDSPHPPEC